MKEAPPGYTNPSHRVPSTIVLINMYMIFYMYIFYFYSILCLKMDQHVKFDTRNHLRVIIAYHWLATWHATLFGKLSASISCYDCERCGSIIPTISHLVFYSSISIISAFPLWKEPPWDLMTTLSIESLVKQLHELVAISSFVWLLSHRPKRVWRL